MYFKNFRKGKKKIKAPAGTCALVTDSKLPVHSNPLCYAVRQQFYERKKDINMILVLLPCKNFVFIVFKKRYA